MWNEDPHNTPAETGIHLAEAVCHHLLKGKIRTPRGGGILPLGGQTPGRTGQGCPPTGLMQMFRAACLQTAPKGSSPSVRPWWSGRSSPSHVRRGRRQGGKNRSHPAAGTALTGRCLHKSLPVPLENSLVARKPQHGVWSQGGVQPGRGHPGGSRCCAFCS